MTDMTQDEIQDELTHRNEEVRRNEYLISKTVQMIISDFLIKTFGVKLSNREKLAHTSSMMAIATEEVAWKRWAQG